MNTIQMAPQSVGFVRHRIPFMIGTGVALLMFLIVVLDALGWADFQGLSQSSFMWWFTLLFVAPVGVYCFAISTVFGATPAVELRQATIALSNVTWPHIQIVLPKKSIRSVRAQWEPKSTYNQLVFTLDDEAVPGVASSRVWVKVRHPGYIYDCTNIAANPDVICERIDRWLRDEVTV